MAIYSKSVEGLDETLIAFSRLVNDKANSFVVAGAEKSANVILSKAKRNLISNGSVRTGKLLNAIEAKQLRSRAKKYSRIIIDQPIFTVGPRYAKISSTKTGGVNYGHLVELGYKSKSKKQIPAKPYLRPAADTSKEEVIGLIIESMNKALEEFGRG